MAATYRLSAQQTLTVTKPSAEAGGERLELEATRSVRRTSPGCAVRVSALTGLGGRAHAATSRRLSKPPPLVQGPLFAAIALVARLLRR
jgi:hypothetical protein